jgi:uncharacterized membrane protein
MAPNRLAKLILLISFTLGAVTGGVTVRVWLLAATPRLTPPVQPIDKLARAVKLDPQQRRQVEVILSEADQQYRQIGQQHQPSFAAIRGQTRERIRSLLTLEQQVLYDRWEQERKASHRTKSK